MTTLNNKWCKISYWHSAIRKHSVQRNSQRLILIQISHRLQCRYTTTKKFSHKKQTAHKNMTKNRLHLKLVLWVINRGMNPLRETKEGVIDEMSWGVFPQRPRMVISLLRLNSDYSSLGSGWCDPESLMSLLASSSPQLYQCDTNRPQTEMDAGTDR